MCLDKHDRIDSMFVLVRPLFESLFNLAAAVNNPQFVAEKHVAEIEYCRTRLEKWTEFEGKEKNNPFADQIHDLSILAEELREKYSITSHKKWKTLEVAKAANLEDHYIREYFMFSQNTHASIAGLIAQENECGRKQIIRCAIHVLLATTGHAAQILPTLDPQQYIDKATSLIKELTQMMREGVFREDGQPPNAE